MNPCITSDSESRFWSAPLPCVPRGSFRMDDFAFVRRISSVVSADLVGVPGVGKVRPVVRIETWCVLEAILGDIENHAFLFRIDTECIPRDREQFVADAEDATEAQYAIGDLATVGIDHDVLEVAKGFVLRVSDPGADQRGC